MNLSDKTALLFDLDGTIINSQSGIFASVRYTLEKLKLPPMSDSQLRPFIGPPLQRSFSAFCGLGSDESIKAVKTYREYYETKGVHMFSVYDGLPQTLDRLNNAGFRLFVATCKPEYFAKKIISESGLTDRFIEVCGVPLNGYSMSKAEVIRKVAADNSLDLNDCVMIGDTAFDINGAKQCGISSLGVRYGFGADGELEAAGADMIVDTAKEIADIFC